MGFFNKTKKDKVEAAADFVLSMCQQAQAQWPSICNGLQTFDSQFQSFHDDKIATYEFTLAAIAVHMHSVKNLLPADQASRIRSHILEGLTIEDVGNYPREAIAEYDAAWESSNPPFHGVASILYEKLDLSSNVTIGDKSFKSPLLIAALGGVIVNFGGAWWKNYIQQHRIVA